MNPTRPMRLCLLFFISMIALGKDSTLPVSSLEQTSFSASTMTLDQSVEWLRKTLLSMGKQRIVMYRGGHFGGSYTDVTCTLVSLDHGVLTLAFTENSNMAGDISIQKFKFTIPLAAVDSQNSYFKVLEPGKDGQLPNGANIVSIRMVKGQTTHTNQVLIEKGKTTTKDFEHQEQTIYLPTKEKAQQTVEVLRRMVELVSKRN